MAGKRVGAVERARIRDIVAILDEMAPPDLAEPWDNVGLLVGDPEIEPAWVAVALDADFAVDLPSGPGLLVVHHPLPFRPLRRLVAGDPEGGPVLGLARRGMSLYAAHTNYDSAPAGLSHRLALDVGLRSDGLRPLVGPGGGFRKLVVFVPATHTAQVRAALAEAGAGWIGAYSDTAFATTGRGYFRPREGAHPFAGAAGQVAEVTEDRLETIVPAHRLGAAIRRMLEAHPYEEPAYDVYLLASCPPVTRPELAVGLGRVGELAAGETRLEDFRAAVERSLGLPAGRARLAGFAGPGSRTVRRVAVCPGAGGGYVRAAAAAGADAYVTGDVTHHQALETVRLGLPLIDAGHLGTEKTFVPAVASTLLKSFATQGISLRIIEVSTPSGWQG